MVRRLRAIALLVVAIVMCALVAMLIGCAWVSRVLHDDDS